MHAGIRNPEHVLSYGDVDEVVSSNPVPAFGVLVLSLSRHPPVSECGPLDNSANHRTSIIRQVRAQDFHTPVPTTRFCFPPTVLPFSHSLQLRLPSRGPLHLRWPLCSPKQILRSSQARSTPRSIYLSCPFAISIGAYSKSPRFRPAISAPKLHSVSERTRSHPYPALASSNDHPSDASVGIPDRGADAFPPLIASIQLGTIASFPLRF
jgi:hypothetical protein